MCLWRLCLQTQTGPLCTGFHLSPDAGLMHLQTSKAGLQLAQARHSAHGMRLSGQGTGDMACTAALLNASCWAASPMAMNQMHRTPAALLLPSG